MKSKIAFKTISSLRQIPSNVWVLGFVSMLMDCSSEMIHSLLPLFMFSTLGLSALTIGLIEGVAESTALIVKVFSGILSDYLGKRKGLTIIGYGLAAITKPLFAIASTASIVLSARILDRIGKGIRGAPRDALVADLAPLQLQGAAYGLRQSLDTLGAVLGPLLAACLMLLWANDYRKVFWVAVIPAVLSVVLLCFFLREPERNTTVEHSNPIKWCNLKKLSLSYWSVVSIGAIFTLARFSEAFLVLRAQQVGVPIALVPLVIVAMNIVYSLSAYPFGNLSDRINRYSLLSLGFVVLIAADLLLALSDHWGAMFIGVLLWGAHMGITQGLLAAMVAKAAPFQLRGTAFGIFYLVSGIAMLMASLIAGLLWDQFGASSTFLAGAFFCVFALIGINWHRYSNIKI